MGENYTLVKNSKLFSYLFRTPTTKRCTKLVYYLLVLMIAARANCRFASNKANY